jgi:hypothetical protein
VIYVKDLCIDCELFHTPLEAYGQRFSGATVAVVERSANKAAEFRRVVERLLATPPQPRMAKPKAKTKKKSVERPGIEPGKAG